jgi:hypothetical protein
VAHRDDPEPIVLDFVDPSAVFAGVGRHGLMVARGWVLTRNIPLDFPTGCAVVKARGAARRCPWVPAERRRQRVLGRPGVTEEKLAALLAKRPPDAEKRRRAELIVDSSQELDDGRAQVRDIRLVSSRTW